MDLYPNQQEAQLSFSWPGRTAYIQRPAFDFRSRNESDFPE